MTIKEKVRRKGRTRHKLATYAFVYCEEAKNVAKNLKKRLTFPANGGIISKLTRESERHRTLKTIQKQQRKGKTVIPNELT